MYRHVNKTNGKQYIGITGRNPENRWGTNGQNYRSTPVFWNAICKYGWDAFEHEIVMKNLTQEQACQIERHLIEQYHTQDRRYGYNVLDGGEMSTLPLEVRQKMSVAMRGNKNGLGKPCSLEKRRKISEAQKGKHLTEEHKQHLSVAKKGKSHAPPSDATRKKIADSHNKCPVYCEELDTVFPSIQECARTLGVDATSVCACCKGRHKSVHGYHLKYYSNT